ncbi:MAG: ATP-binding protein [Candidatus Paceibacterota bacterium]
MIYFEVRKENGDIVASNMQECPFLFLIGDNKNITLRDKGIKSVFSNADGVNVWMVVDKDEKDLLNSNRLFNKTIKTHAVLSKELLNYYFGKIRVHSHTLRSIQGKMKQKIEGLVSKDDFRAENYAESKEKVGKKISSNIDKTADTICFLNKRVMEIDSHINGFDVLYMGDEQETSFQNVNIKKVILSILAPFLDELSKKNINMEIAIKDDYADSNRINLDYKMFNLAMNNFFDNAVKYSKQSEPIKVTFSKEDGIEVSMMSRRIEENKLARVFDEGYSGTHAQRDAGDGIGMSITDKALRLTKMKMTITPNYSESYKSQDNQYTRNVFKIKTI